MPYGRTAISAWSAVQLLQIRPNLLVCNSFGGTPTVTGNGAGVAAVPATQLQGF